MNDIVTAERLVRSEYLGSSDAAAILGISKWKTPLDVWRAKVAPASADDADQDRAKILRRGQLLEPVIRTMAVEDHDLEILSANTRVVDEDHDFLRAEIDFVTLDPDGSVVNNEAKSVSPFAAGEWGEEGTDEIPLQYHAQIQFALMVSGAPVERCDVWALFGTDNLLRYVVQRDEETIAAMRDRCVQFWHDHVIARVPPAPVTLDDVEFLMRGRRGKPLLANPEHMDWVAELRELKHKIKGAEARVEELRLAITTALLEGADGGLGEDDGAALIDPYTDKPLLTWKPQRAERVDIKALRASAPEIAAQYTTTSTSRVLRLAKA
jgi:putative phage-type endonuclease